VLAAAMVAGATRIAVPRIRRVDAARAATVFMLIPFIRISFFIEKILLPQIHLELNLLDNDENNCQGVHVDEPVSRAIG